MMSLRPAYRIASHAVLLPDPRFAQPFYEHTAAQRVQLMAKSVQSTTHFSFDNVASFYAAHDRQVWDASEDIPNWAPPFREFFVEWRDPKHEEYDSVAQ